MQHSALEWEEVFGDEVPCAAARRVEDMFDHPQVLAEDMVGDIEHPVIGRYRGVTRPITFGRTPGPDPFAAPVFNPVDATGEVDALAIQEPGKA
jgi:crotonobetainyl-CoA:carnitine CoA-transferase CaiB-like acyl-CoA transferase